MVRDDVLVGGNYRLISDDSVLKKGVIATVYEINGNNVYAATSSKNQFLIHIDEFCKDFEKV